MKNLDNTLLQYKKIVSICKFLFEGKNHDYGTSWRILRLPSITDQIMIKAQRIRVIQESNAQRIEDSIDTEFVGIVNYSVMAIIQLELQNNTQLEIDYEKISQLYDKAIEQARHLLENKNHDYQEVWRDMRLGSIVDIILMKLLRIKKIEDNNKIILISEGIESNYLDIINYGVLCLIKTGYGI